MDRKFSSSISTQKEVGVPKLPLAQDSELMLQSDINLPVLSTLVSKGKMGNPGTVPALKVL